MQQPYVTQQFVTALAVQVYPVAGPWGRALDWWRAASELAPALPLGLAADLGALLSGVAPPANRGDSCALFLRAAAATPAVRAAHNLTLSDVAIAALLAYLAEGVPMPPAYRLPPGVRPAQVVTALTEALTSPPPTTPDSSLIFDYPSSHILDRLQALTPDDVRFVAELGQGALGVTDLADLRALTELLSLPALRHSLIAEVLAFLPALAEVTTGTALQTYAVDGYGGLARSGPLDALLPSEWALPSVLLTYRYLNGELLYYGRERPPERRTTLLLVFVQLSDATAGDLEPLIKASALALARAGQARGATVRVAVFNTGLQPPGGLGLPSEVAAFVGQPSRGGVDLVRVVGQVEAEVRAQAHQYARVELLWLLHAQAGADQVGAVTTLAGWLRRVAGSRALFVSAGPEIRLPALAGRLAGQWASLGSAALHVAEERAKAVRALRGLARPSERERLAVEAPPAPRRRITRVDQLLMADPVEGLLDSARWEEAFAALEPRVRQGEKVATALLATLVEGPALRPVPGAQGRERAALVREGAGTEGEGTDGAGEEIGGVGHRSAWGRGSWPPLALRRRAAGLLGEVGDPRLLDLRTGDAALGGYWRLIEAGPFWFGDDREEQLRQVRLDYAYRIGRYPVTNTEYGRFIEAGGYADRRWWTEHGWAERAQWGWIGPSYWDDRRFNQPNQPVVGVSWYEATAYCAWLTHEGHTAGWLPSSNIIRLPVWLEWERAARGIDQRRYPWGSEEPDGERANYQGIGIGVPTAVGCFPAGVASCGALDMAGNVMEWTSTPAGSSEQVRGERDVGNRVGVLLSRSGCTADHVALLCCGAREGNFPLNGSFHRSYRLLWSLALGK